MNFDAVEKALEQGVMSFSNLFRKAANLFAFGGDVGRTRPPPLDGEIIFCKNNVCVHPPTNLNSISCDHFPGYLNIRSQDDDILGSTLILTWIPNSTLNKNPRSIDNSPALACITSRRSPRQDYSRADLPSSSRTVDSSFAECDTMSKNEDCSLAINNGSSIQTIQSDYSSPSKSSTNDVNLLRCMLTDVRSNDASETVTSVGASIEISTTSSEIPVVSEYVDDVIKYSELAPKVTEVNSCATTTSMSSTLCMHPHLAKLHSHSVSSVTSIEMDGDNLVIVTKEALNDEAFTPNTPMSTVSDKSANTLWDEGSSQRTADEFRQTCNKWATAAHMTETINNRRIDTHLQLTLNSDEQKLALKVSDIDLKSAATADTPYLKTRTSSSSTSGPDSIPPSPTDYPPQPNVEDKDHMSSVDIMSSCVQEGGNGSDYARHHMSFPDNAIYFNEPELLTNSTPGDTAIEQVCGVFSVDLGQMRSLRIFYSDLACTSGQLVIASRESQYKILHFHHGGLDRLAETFADWKFLAQPRHKMGDVDMHCHHFSVIRPYLTNDQCHPEDGALEVVSEATWRRHMNSCGQIEDDFHLRKAIFFAGLESSIRHEIWPFLLHYFPYTSTFEEREHLRNDRFIEYQNIRKIRETMTVEEKESFMKNVQCTIEKDVVRTDRCNPYFCGEGNPNIDTLKNILLNYAVAHPLYGYTQGMSDLLAPVLTEIQNEVDTYWCFVGLMQKTTFFSSPTDVDMDSQLTYLRELLRLLLPHFYHHLKKVQDGLELLFCHRLW